MSLVLPDAITPAIDDALGMMNFQTGPIAHVLRASGDDIPRKTEREQAHVLFWFLRLAIEHGDKWREAAGDELGRRREILLDEMKKRGEAS
jgi:hypothetical protein